jgi:hypothetical protein
LPSSIIGGLSRAGLACFLFFKFFLSKLLYFEIIGIKFKKQVEEIYVKKGKVTFYIKVDLYDYAKTLTFGRCCGSK